MNLAELDITSLPEEEVRQLNSWANFFAYKPHPLWSPFITCTAYILGLFTGNQMGKTAMICRSYVLRILGLHPVPWKNLDWLQCTAHVNPDDPQRYKHAVGIFSPARETMVCSTCAAPLQMFFNPIRVIRFASEILPGEAKMTTTSVEAAELGLSGSAEIRNTQYPELKKWLPESIMKEDIKHRTHAMILNDIHGGPDIIIEFVSYNQETQTQAGVQRFSIFYDEEPPPDFWEEQQPRLIAADGDQVIGLTPANRITHLYDTVYEKARLYIRTKTISKHFDIPERETTDSQQSIAVFEGATDDNPTLTQHAIDRIFSDVDDPDVIEIRRYGRFKQISGRIFKGYEVRTHRIHWPRWFPHGIRHDWLHARLMDYHKHVKLAIMWITLSPEDEAFVYCEFNPDPGKLVTWEIAEEMAALSGDYEYRYNLIDPLANEVQTNTGLTVVQDLNRHFHELKVMGQGTGGYWRPWDTKSERGREQIRTRLKNAKRCGVPFNNLQMIEDRSGNARSTRLPTLWISDECPLVHKSLKLWRLEEWADASAVKTKEQKESPQQRWSHFPMCLEAIFKDAGFRARPARDMDHVVRKDPVRKKHYLNQRRAG